MINCQICGKEYSQMSASHLRAHNTTMAQYKEQFPNVEIVGQEVRDKISQKNSSRIRSEEHKANLSSSIQKGFVEGRVIHNKGLKGQWRDMSQEEREMRSDAAMNRPPMTEETKRKISAKSLGRKMPSVYVKRMTARVRANPPRPMLGTFHTEEAKQKMRSNINRPSWEQYKLEVDRLSNPIRERLKKMGITFGNTNNLDHIIPKFQGFQENIPPELIGSIANLQILSENENKKKGNKVASILIKDDIQTLYEDSDLNLTFVINRKKILF